MSDFWDLPRWSKWDELDDERHAYIWGRALRDSETGVEKLHKDYILYGPDQALLLRPKRTVMHIGMTLYDKMLQVFKRDE